MKLSDRLRAWWARVRGRDVFRDSRGRICFARKVPVGEPFKISGLELAELFEKKHRETREDLS